MNALVLPDRAEIPPMPLALEAQVAALASPARYGAGEDAVVLAAPAMRSHPEAAKMLAQMVPLCRQPDRAVVRAWFVRLARAVRNPPGEGDFEARVAAIVGAVADLPAAVWTAETLTEACRVWPWWPAAADVDGLLRPRAEALWRTQNALKRITYACAPIPTAGGPEPPTEAEKLAVALSVQAARAALSSRSLDAPAKPPMPRRRSHDVALLVGLEAAGAAGDVFARRRADALRNKLEAMEPAR